MTIYISIFLPYLNMTHVEIINDVNVLLYNVFQFIFFTSLCVFVLLCFLLWLLLSSSISFIPFFKKVCLPLLTCLSLDNWLYNQLRFFFWWYTNNYNKRFHHHKEVPTSLDIAMEHNKLLILIFLCIPCLYSISQ